MNIDLKRLEDLTLAVQEDMANDPEINLAEFHWQFMKMERQLEMIKGNIDMLMRIFGVDEE